MKILFSRILLVAVILTSPVLAQTAGDAVSVDPDIHRVILDNEHIRVFDARASVGAKSPMHTHPPMVLTSIGKTRFRMTMQDGKTSIFDVNPGQVIWIPGAQHSWELLAGELHAIGVEIKSAQQAEAPPQPTTEQRQGDAVTVDPDVHHVLLENPHVRVFEGRTSHGDSSPIHRHPPSLLISLDWIRLKITTPEGATSLHDFSPGQVLWVGGGGTHSWEAIAGSGRVIAIEVKSAQAAMRKE